MNILESHNTTGSVIHKNIPILLFKGGVAWLLWALFDYFFDLLPQMSAVYSPAPVTGLTNLLVSNISLFHLVINILFGWLLLYVVLSWYQEYYIVSDDAIIVHKGILFTREDVYQIEDLKSIDVTQGFWGKIFNTGTLEFYAFRLRKDIYLSHISDPYALATRLHELHPHIASLSWPNQKNRRPGRGLRAVRSGPLTAQEYNYDD